MNKTYGTMPSIVIVGAGFGGLKAARRLSRVPARITVVDKHNHHLFQPLLYQVATASLSPADIAFPIRSILKSHRNTEVLMTSVIGVDPTNRRVLTTDGALDYDYLILATGSDYNYFGHEEWEEFAPNLKSLADATTIREKVLSAFERAEIETDWEKKKRLLTFVLVGAGPTGVELAGALAEIAHRTLAKDFRHIDPRSARILLLDGVARILMGFPEPLALKAHHALEGLGVEIRTNARVTAVDGQGVLLGEERIHAATVLWTAGVKASAPGRWLNVNTDRIGRVLVSADLSVPGLPEVYVIGDAACVLDSNGKPLPGVAPVAMQQGVYVAELLIRKIEGGGQTQPFMYRDKGNLATIGRSFAIADFGKIRMSGLFAWFLWLIVHIFYLIGFKNRLLVVIQWAWAYLTFQRGTRLILTAREKDGLK